jgi:hypothetical protein
MPGTARLRVAVFYSMVAFAVLDLIDGIPAQLEALTVHFPLAMP